MDLQRRSFPLIVAIGVLVTPAFGTASDSAKSVPDLSGIWLHANPGFEPMRSGPTSLVNRSRRPNGTGDILKLAGDYTNPILKPDAAEIVRKHGELGLNYTGDPNPRNQRRPEGPPFVFSNGPTHLVQTADKVTIIYGYNHQVRRVRMNQSHPAHVTPSWYGDSVGHYEGGTLVVDTVGMKIGPYSMVDWYGTPHVTRCTSSSATGCRIMKGQRKVSSATLRSIMFPTESPWPTRKANICSSSSPSKTKAHSRRPGPRR
jgi:hypothetical protein